MTEATVDAEELIRDLQCLIGDESIFKGRRRDLTTKEDYREEVEEIADSVLNKYDQDGQLYMRIHNEVRDSQLVKFKPKCSLPIRYHGHEPCKPELFIEIGSPVQGLAFACLVADVEAKVEKHIEALENESLEGDSDE